jgi:hypothetical protein
MKVVRAFSVYAFLFTLVTSARALNPDRDIHQLAHRSWGEKEGYPGRTQALAQTADGFLWLGTDNGIYRFDGSLFDQYQPSSGGKIPEGSVRAMLAVPDGSLWIAYRLGNRICVLRNSDLKCYGKADGVPSNAIAIVQDHEGVIWANTETGLIRLNGNRWESIGKAWNYPEDIHYTEDSTALFVDSRGTLWTGVNQTVLYLKRGSRQFEPTGVFAGWSVSIAEAPDGTIWLADNRSYVRAIGVSVSARAAAIARCEVAGSNGASPKCPGDGPLVIQIRSAVRILFDRNGSLWMTTDASGLFRVPHSERLSAIPVSKTDDRLQAFDAKDGLSADNCTPVLEDREGNIWVATRDGLDQFRDTALTPVVLPTSLSRIAIAPADGGDIWVAGSWTNVARLHGGAESATFAPADAFKPYRDPGGVTWFVGNSLGQWKNGRLQKVAEAPRSSRPWLWFLADCRRQTRDAVGLFRRLWILLFGIGPMESLGNSAGCEEAAPRKHFFRQHGTYLGIDL